MKKPLLIVLLILPFFLNDLFYLGKNDGNLIWIVDYTTRFFVIALCFYAIKKPRIDKSYFGLRWISNAHFVFWTITLCLLIPASSILIEEFLVYYLGKTTFTFPAYSNDAFRIVDLTVGMLLIGLSEEMVFRGALLSYLREKNISPIIIVVISCIVFGTMHWSMGLSKVIILSFSSIIPTVWALKYRTIYPLVIEHAFFDYLYFAQIIKL